MLKSRRFWLASAVSLVFLAFFFSRLDVAETWEQLGKASYPQLVPAIAAYFAAVLFRTVRWRYLLAPMKSLSVSRLYPVVVVGYMANNVLPVRLGEVVRAYFVGEREGVSKTASLATIAVERVFDGLTLLFFAAVVSLFLPLEELLQGLGDTAGVPWLFLASAMSLPFVITAAIMVLASSSPRWPERVVYSVTSLMPGRLASKVRTLVTLFIEGLAVLKSPKRLLMVFLLSLPVWLLEALMYYFVAFSFDLNNVFSPAELVGVVLLVTATSNLAASIPAAGGGIGTFEVAAAATLTIFGADASLAGAYTIVLHLALLLPVTLLGFLFLWTQNVSLGQLARESRSDAGTTPGSTTNVPVNKEASS